MYHPTLTLTLYSDGAPPPPPQTKDEARVPLTINCWPSVSGGDSYVNIEYEAHAGFDLQNVVISIPCHTAPRVNEARRPRAARPPRAPAAPHLRPPAGSQQLVSGRARARFCLTECRRTYDTGRPPGRDRRSAQPGYGCLLRTTGCGFDITRPVEDNQ